MSIRRKPSYYESGDMAVGQSTGGADYDRRSCLAETMHDSPNDIVSNEVSITVDGPASLGCPQGAVTATLALNVTVICPFACAATFPLGTAVTLSATPNPGKSFIGWGGCDSQAGLTCTVTLSMDRTVTASFN